MQLLTSYRMVLVYGGIGRIALRVNMGGHAPTPLVEELYRDARGNERWMPAQPKGTEAALTALLAWFLRGGRRVADGTECSIGEVRVPDPDDDAAVYQFDGLSAAPVDEQRSAVNATTEKVEAELFEPSTRIARTDWQTAKSCAHEIAKRIESGLFAAPEEEDRWRHEIWMLMENLACCLRFERKGAV